MHGFRKIAQFESLTLEADKKAVIYYDPVNSEYVVTFSCDNVFQTAATYFTDDIDDAKATAKFFI